MSGSQAGGRSDLLTTSKATGGVAAINSAIDRLEGLGAVEDNQREVCILLLPARHGDPELFDSILRLPDACRVRKLDGPAAERRPGWSRRHESPRGAGSTIARARTRPMH